MPGEGEVVRRSRGERDTGEGDRAFLAELREIGAAVVAVNKIDRIARADVAAVEQCGHELPEAEIVPVSALKGENVDELLVRDQADAAREAGADAARRIHRPDRADDRGRDRAREDVSDDAPGDSVFDRRQVEKFVEEPDRNLVKNRRTIIVEREAHKGMLIGAGGQQLKQIGTAARLELEKMLGAHVFLELLVKVERDWTRNPRKIAELGL